MVQTIYRHSNTHWGWSAIVSRLPLYGCYEDVIRIREWLELLLCNSKILPATIHMVGVLEGSILSREFNSGCLSRDLYILNLFAVWQVTELATSYGCYWASYKL